MTATYFDSVTSKANYEKRKAAEATSSIRGLQVLGRVPTSSWGTPQLLACRVFVAACNDPNTLPVFADRKTPDFTQTLRKRLRAERPTGATDGSGSPRERALLQLEKLCRGPQDTTPRSEHRRVWDEGNSFGQIWAALDCVRSDAGGAYMAQAAVTPRKRYQDPPSSPVSDLLSSPPVPLPNLLSSRPALQPRPPASPQPHPPPGTRRASSRASKPPSRPGFTSTTEDFFGSSSPPSSSVISDPHSNYAGDPGPSAGNKLYPEVLTVRFASAFIRLALPWLPSQDDPDADIFVTFDDCPARHETSRLGACSFASQDDGGLAITIYGSREGRVALLEAKRTMGRPVDGTLLLSDDCLGQMVGEALAARLVPDAWSGPEDCIIVILAARHNIRFLQVEIPDQYVTQLLNHARDDETPFTEYIRVTATRWFDLCQADDRCETILNLAAIVDVASSTATTAAEDG